MSRRHLDWPERLNAAVDARRETPFKWGEHDCCMLACSIIAELTGIDPASDLRGKYYTRLGATRVLNRLGGVEVIADARTAEHGFKELKSPRFAQRGDLVLFDIPMEGPALGICIGSRAVFTAPHGLSFVPVGECRRAWRVE